MADISHIANALSGVGAGLQGRGIEFQRNQLAQEEQRRRAAQEDDAQLAARRKAIFNDSQAALKLAKEGRFDLAAQLGISRIQSAGQIPGIDPAGTVQLTQLAQMAADGNKEAGERLIKSLENNVKLGSVSFTSSAASTPTFLSPTTPTCCRRSSASIRRCRSRRSPRSRSRISPR